MIIQVQRRGVSAGLVCGLVLSGRIRWITDLESFSSFGLFVATLVKVAPGLAYVFKSHQKCLQAVNSHQRHTVHGTICFDRDGSECIVSYGQYWSDSSHSVCRNERPDSADL